MTMRPTLKAGLLLGATFVLGAALGAVLQGGLSHRRQDELARVRGPGGFVAEMDRVIHPRDDQQASAIRPALVRTDARNRRIVDGAQHAMRATLDSMRVELAPLLDADQQQRLDDFARRPPRAPLPGNRPAPR